MSKKMAIKKAENKKRSFSFKWWRPLKKILLLIFIVGGGYFSAGKISNYYLKLWPIKTIAFTEKTQHLDKGLIANKLKQKERGGLVSIDLRQLQREILDNPWIKAVKIQKKWPETLIFTVKEHKAIALVNGHYLLETGQLLAEKSVARSKDLLTIHYENSEDKSVDWLSLVKKINAMKSILQEQQLTADEFIFDKNKTWSVKLNHQFILTIGRKHQHSRVERFTKIYSAIEQPEKIRSIDLRYESGVAVEYLDRELSDKRKS